MPPSDFPGSGVPGRVPRTRPPLLTGRRALVPTRSPRAIKGSTASVDALVQTGSRLRDSGLCCCPLRRAGWRSRFSRAALH